MELWSGNSVLPTLLVVLLFLSAARWYDAGATKVASSLALVGASILLVQRAPSRRWFVDWLGASGGWEGSGSGQHKRRKTTKGPVTDGTTIDEATKAPVFLRRRPDADPNAAARSERLKAERIADRAEASSPEELWARLEASAGNSRVAGAGLRAFFTEALAHSGRRRGADRGVAERRRHRSARIGRSASAVGRAHAVYGSIKEILGSASPRGGTARIRTHLPGAPLDYTILFAHTKHAGATFRTITDRQSISPLAWFVMRPLPTHRRTDGGADLTPRCDDRRYEVTFRSHPALTVRATGTCQVVDVEMPISQIDSIEIAPLMAALRTWHAQRPVCRRCRIKPALSVDAFCVTCAEYY